jgi:SOS response regulatory protein OraA/RecX
MDNKILARMSIETEAERNGQIMRAIGMLAGYRFVALKQLRMAMAGEMSQDEVAQAINYLTDKGYLNTRTNDDKHLAASVSDAALDDLESKWTPRGKELMYGMIDDEQLVKV